MRLELDMLVALLGLALDLIYILILLVVLDKLMLVLDSVVLPSHCTERQSP